MNKPFDILASKEFATAAKEVSGELREGADIEPAEIAARLGLPLDFLLACAATWHAAQHGAPVVIIPNEEGTVH